MKCFHKVGSFKKEYCDFAKYNKFFPGYTVFSKCCRKYTILFYEKFHVKLKVIYKIFKIVGALSLVDRCAQMKVCNYGCDATLSAFPEKYFIKAIEDFFPRLHSLI